MHVCSVLRMVYIQLAVFLLESKLKFTACLQGIQTPVIFLYFCSHSFGNAYTAVHIKILASLAS